MRVFQALPSQSRLDENQWKTKAGPVLHLPDPVRQAGSSVCLAGRHPEQAVRLGAAVSDRGESPLTSIVLNWFLRRRKRDWHWDELAQPRSGDPSRTRWKRHPPLTGSKEENRGRIPSLELGGTRTQQVSVYTTSRNSRAPEESSPKAEVPPASTTKN